MLKTMRTMTRNDIEALARGADAISSDICQRAINHLNIGRGWHDQDGCDALKACVVASRIPIDIETAYRLAKSGKLDRLYSEDAPSA